MRSLGRKAAAFALDRAGLLSRRVAASGRAAIVMYHRVLERSDPAILDMHPGMVVRLESFRMQLDEYARSFSVVPLEKVVAWTRGAALEVDRPCLAITFDDGWADTARIAAPELSRRGMPATVFCAVDYVRSAERGQPFATRAQLREMASLGFEIGCHTWSHRELVGCGPDDLRHELTDARRWLEQELGRAVRHFAYPRGRHDPSSVAAARATFDAAVTTRPGRVDRGADAALLPRVGIHDDMTRTRALLRWRLAGLP